MIVTFSRPPPPHGDDPERAGTATDLTVQARHDPPGRHDEHDRHDPPGRHDVRGTEAMPAGTGEQLPFDAAWCLVVATTDGPDDDAGVRESLLALADGAVGTRGVLEEDAGAGAVVAAGLYEPADIVGERLVSMPSWCRLPVAGGLSPGRRVLDLRDGVLTRATDNGAASLRTARFACIAQPGTGVLAVEVDAALFDTGGPSPEPIAGTGAGGTGGAGRTDRPAPGAQPPSDRDGVDMETFSSPIGGGVARASRTTWLEVPGRTATTPTGPTAATITTTGLLALHRIVTHRVEARSLPDPEIAAASLAKAVATGGRELLAEQRRAWSRRWASADVAVPGDPATTLSARFAVFHVLSSVAHDGEAAVGARGLTGPAYAGHVFWDTEAFVLPLVAAVDGQAARAVLEYRLRRLGPARRAAATGGRAGARFPWESASTGDDVTPRSGTDQHGDVVPIRTGDLEEHVTADIAWAAWHHAAWQGDWAFLKGPGRPLLVDTARYWVDRVAWDADGRAHVDGVIGPDEYHEHVDDNAFTNIMARFNLLRAAELVERTGPVAGEAEEAAEWRRTAAALVDGLDTATGRYEQFAGYDRLQPLPVSALGTPPLAADLILGPERLAATTIIKQADVLMAHLLVPEETAPGSLRVNLDRYLPFTAHGSSLSPAVHATLLARAGRDDEALALLDLATAIDLDDVTQTTSGGLHLANLAGVWRVLVQGFAGVSVLGPDDRALRIDPRLPDAWPELKVAVRWHGQVVRLSCRHDSVHVACDRALQVDVGGTQARVEPPGRWIG